MTALGARVLVADDDATTRFLARAVLEALGCVVVEAADGLEAVARFEEQACDLVLLDGLMPRLDGFAACAAIRSQPGGARALILMLTGLEDPDALERACEAGASDFLKKPIDYVTLGQRLRLMLHNRPAEAAATPAPPHRPELEQLERRLSAAQRHGRLLAVLAVQALPGRLAALLGRERARELKRRLDERLRTQLRLEDELSPPRRGSGGGSVAAEEFEECGATLVLLDDLRVPDDALRVAERLCRALEAPVELGEQACLAEPRVGVALYPGDGVAPGPLADRALAALALAREDHGARCRCFDAARDALARERLALAAELRDALERGELQLDCRPIRTPGGRCLGARLLPRLEHARLGSLSLEELRDLLRESGLTQTLDQSLIEQAAELVDVWRRKGTPPRLTAPVSAALLCGPELPALLRRISACHALELDWLELECLDPVPWQAEPVAEVLRRLKALGPSLALAQPGAGFATLGRLDRVPADRLCVDAAFTRQQPDADSIAARLRPLADLAHGLGLGLRVDGADSAGQLEALERAGCDEALGAQAGPLLPAWNFFADVWTADGRGEG